MAEPSRRVLIVDDEEPIRRFEVRVLGDAGYKTDVAEDGAQALKIMEESGPFDLVIADFVMPGIWGDDLVRQLRQKQPDLKVLYVTAYGNRLCREVVKTTLWQNEAYLDKPFTIDGLLGAVSRILLGPTILPH